MPAVHPVTSDACQASLLRSGAGARRAAPHRAALALHGRERRERVAGTQLTHSPAEPSDTHVGRGVASIAQPSDVRWRLESRSLCRRGSRGRRPSIVSDALAAVLDRTGCALLMATRLEIMVARCAVTRRRAAVLLAARTEGCTPVWVARPPARQLNRAWKVVDRRPTLCGSWTRAIRHPCRPRCPGP